MCQHLQIRARSRHENLSPHCLPLALNMLVLSTFPVILFSRGNKPGKTCHMSSPGTSLQHLSVFDLGHNFPLVLLAKLVVSPYESSCTAAVFEGVLLSNAAYLLINLFPKSSGPRKPIYNTSLFKCMCQKPTHSACQAWELDIKFLNLWLRS